MENPLLGAIALSALVTVFVRAMPIVLLSRVRLPVLIQDWLGFIPAAIMSAIIAAELMAHPALTNAGWSISFLAAIAAFLIGSLSRSLLWTVLAGIGAFMILRLFLP